jgi:hypothetical protein
MLDMSAPSTMGLPLAALGDRVREGFIIKLDKSPYATLRPQKRWGAMGQPPPLLVDNDHGHISYFVAVMVRHGKGTRPAHQSIW